MMTSHETSLSAAPLRRAALARLLNSTLGPLVALVAVYLTFAILAEARPVGGSLFNWRAIQAVAVHTADVAVPAFGMTIIIIAGGIDLSMGAAVALAATTTAWAFLKGMGPVEGLAIGMATGALVGAANGALVSALRIVPFIVTLGTMMICRGMGRWLAADTPIRPPRASFDWIAEFQAPYPKDGGAALASGVWVMLVLALGVMLLLRYSVFGRHVFALGSNEATARLCGIRVPATRIAVYAVGGLLAGVGGIYQFANLGEGDPMAGAGKELHYIAAVVVGGGSLNGGRGSILGTLSGAALMAVISHGCGILEIGSLYQDMIIGAIIIAAVALDQLRQRKLGE